MFERKEGESAIVVAQCGADDFGSYSVRSYKGLCFNSPESLAMTKEGKDVLAGDGGVVFSFLLFIDDVSGKRISFLRPILQSREDEAKSAHIHTCFFLLISFFRVQTLDVGEA